MAKPSSQVLKSFSACCLHGSSASAGEKQVLGCLRVSIGVTKNYGHKASGGGKGLFGLSFYIAARD